MSSVAGGAAAVPSNPPSALGSAAGGPASLAPASVAGDADAGVASGNAAQIVELNVGGVPYTTTLGVLQRHPSSQLAQTFQEPYALSQDAQGRWFIDRNGALFSYVLDFLRDGGVWGVSPDDIPKITQLANEFAHFGLPHVLPFEELFKRADMTTYSLSSARGGNGGGAAAAQHSSAAGGACYSHIRLCARQDSPTVVQVDVPKNARVPRPTTALLDEVLEHYGRFGYRVCSTCATATGLLFFVLVRDSSGDLNGAFPSVTGARPGSHPSSQPPPGTAELPPQVMEILNRVSHINSSIGNFGGQ